MVNKKSGKNCEFPTEENLRWDYFCGGEKIPPLQRGQRVLVSVWNRNRLAVCQGPIAGGLRWAQLCAPCNGIKRVVVSRHSLIAVESNEK